MTSGVGGRSTEDNRLLLMLLLLILFISLLKLLLFDKNCEEVVFDKSFKI